MKRFFLILGFAALLGVVGTDTILAQTPETANATQNAATQGSTETPQAAAKEPVTFKKVAGYMTPGNPPQRLNKYEIRYRYGDLYNCRPHARWNPCGPPGAGPHHAHHHHGYFGHDYSQRRFYGAGGVPARLVPERGVQTMPAPF